MTISPGFRDAIRTLLRRPGLGIIIVLTLALGVGVNAGIFSIFHQVMLQELEVPDPGELVVFHSPGPRDGSVSTDGTGRVSQIFSYPLYEDLQSAGDRLTGIGAFRAIAANVSARGHTSSGSGLLVSGNYFEVLDVHPVAGRFFGNDEVVSAGAPRVAVLSHSFWQERFGADPSVIGESIIINGESLEIIGVAPPGFRGLNRFNRTDVFAPVTLVGDLVLGDFWNLETRRSHWLYVFGRLADGATVEQAEATLEPAFKRVIREIEAPLQQDHSDNWIERFVARELELLPAAQGQANTLEAARTPLTLLLVVAGLVLVVACVNIANLLLALGASERGATAVRQALGARRRHILVQRMTVLGLLALAGALIALPVALGTLRLVLFLLPADNGVTISAALDWRVIAAGLAASAVAMVLAGLVPVFQAFGTRPIEAIRDQDSRSGPGRSAARFRSGLVSAQIALALALLVVSGLFIKSLANINSVDLGVRPEPVLSFSISPARNGYSPERSRELFHTVEQRLSALPGVASASASMVPILSDTNWDSNVSVQGFESSPDTNTNARYNAVGPAFFDALSIPFLRGRRFSERDVADRTRVAIVNQSFIRKFDMGRDAVGKRMSQGSGGDLDIEIIGVVADAAYSNIKQGTPPQFFLSIYQMQNVGSANFYVRAIADPEALVPAVRDVIAELDPDLPVDNMATMDEVIDNNAFLDRTIGTLASMFAILATVLASVGLFGVLSFMLAQRTGEMGLRAALGASPTGLRCMVLIYTLRLAAAGGAMGLVLAWLLGRLARGLLYELSPLEPWVLLGAVTLLFAVILTASWIPARRAAEVQPVQALRYE